MSGAAPSAGPCACRSGRPPGRDRLNGAVVAPRGSCTTAARAHNMLRVGAVGCPSIGTACCATGDARVAADKKTAYAVPARTTASADEYRDRIVSTSRGAVMCGKASLTFVIALALLAAGGTARAQAPTSPDDGAEMPTDRPGFNAPASVVGAGVVQLELGWATARSRDRTYASTVPPALLRVGAATVRGIAGGECRARGGLRDRLRLARGRRLRSAAASSSRSSLSASRWRPPRVALLADGQFRGQLAACGSAGDRRRPTTGRRCTWNSRTTTWSPASATTIPTARSCDRGMDSPSARRWGRWTPIRGPGVASRTRRRAGRRAWRRWALVSGSRAMCNWMSRSSRGLNDGGARHGASRQESRCVAGPVDRRRARSTLSVRRGRLVAAGSPCPALRSPGATHPSSSVAQWQSIRLLTGGL